jgi:hypothetical protein
MKMHCTSYACRLLLIFIFQHPIAHSQVSPPNTQVESQQQREPISGNVALYTFLRVISTDDASDPADKARSAALLSAIGLTEGDRLTLQSICVEYATDLRSLYEEQAPNLSPLDLQKNEVRLYGNAVRRIRTELSPDGVKQLRSHLETKKEKMKMHTHEEAVK